MIYYIPHKNIASNKKEWKRLMRNTIDQIVSYPTYERPACDLAIIGPQINKFYNHEPDKDGIVEFKFGDYYFLFTLKEKLFNIDYRLMVGKHIDDYMSEIQIKGKISKSGQKHLIYFRDIIIGTPEIDEHNDVDFSEIKSRTIVDGEISVYDVLAEPDFTVESEQFNDNEFSW